jgi:RimJ/RimL family protein N-acetyltransferase
MAARTDDTTARVVQQLRSAPRAGQVVDLIPYAALHHRRLVALRNESRASYYLHQPAPLTIAAQSVWYNAYLARHDDVQWVIARKDGVVVGGTALYGIAADRSRAEKGRLVVDPSHAMEAPYALEAELLLLDVAFNALGIAQVETCVRHNNLPMQSINARLGFTPVGQHQVRGVDYYDYSLTATQYAPTKLYATLDAWSRRLTTSVPAHA